MFDAWITSEVIVDLEPIKLSVQCLNLRLLVTQVQLYFRNGSNALKEK